MTDPVPPKRIFPEAHVDAKAARHVPSSPQTESAAYKLAFQDTDFLLREDLRPVRFQLELLKPELLLDEAKIASTFVVYGSARIPDPSMADALVAGASDGHQRAIAERLKAKSHYYDVALELGRLAGACGPDEDGWRHFVVCSGGGPSFMRGVPRAKADQCLANQAEINQLVQMNSDAIASFNIPGTPTFLINGSVVDATATWELLEPKLKDALAS